MNIPMLEEPLSYYVFGVVVVAIVVGLILWRKRTKP